MQLEVKFMSSKTKLTTLVCISFIVMTSSHGLHDKEKHGHGHSQVKNQKQNTVKTKQIKTR